MAVQPGREPGVGRAWGERGCLRIMQRARAGDPASQHRRFQHLLAGVAPDGDARLGALEQPRRRVELVGVDRVGQGHDQENCCDPAHDSDIACGRERDQAEAKENEAAQQRQLRGCVSREDDRRDRRQQAQEHEPVLLGIIGEQLGCEQGGPQHERQRRHAPVEEIGRGQHRPAGADDHVACMRPRPRHDRHHQPAQSLRAGDLEEEKDPADDDRRIEAQCHGPQHVVVQVPERAGYEVDDKDDRDERERRRIGRCGAERPRGIDQQVYRRNRQRREEWRDAEVGKPPMGRPMPAERGNEGERQQDRRHERRQ